jgi:excisionase family DNA binding protein
MANTTAPDEAPDLLTTTEVAVLARVTRATVARWARDGRLRHSSTPGGRLRFARADVLAALAGERAA